VNDEIDPFIAIGAGVIVSIAIGERVVAALSPATLTTHVGLLLSAVSGLILLAIFWKWLLR
jgi:uncharacterized membrane protein YfcA